MASSPVFPLAAGTVAGLLTATLTCVLLVPRLSPRPAPTIADGAAGESAAATSPKLEAAVARLEQRLARVERALGTLVLRAPVPTASADGAGGTRSAAPFVDPEDPVFKESVQAVLESTRQEQRERRKQSELQRVEHTLGEWEEKLGLSANQRLRLKEVLERAIRRRFEQPMGPDGQPVQQDRAERRESMRRQREEREKSILEVLDPKQQETYRAELSLRGRRDR